MFRFDRQPKPIARPVRHTWAALIGTPVYVVGFVCGLLLQTFARAGSDIFLESGDSFEVTVNDDLSGLVEHIFTVEGTYGWVKQPTTNEPSVFK